MIFGRRIYYEKQTGKIVWDTGERVDTTNPSIEEDFVNYKALAERVVETVGVIELEPGQYAQDFLEGFLDHVNPETKQLYFRYPDLNNPETPQEPRKPLSVEVEELKQENTLLRAQNSALTERTEFIEDVIAEMAIQVYQ